MRVRQLPLAIVCVPMSPLTVGTPRVRGPGRVPGLERRILATRSTIRRVARADLDDPASASSPLPFLSMSRRDPGAVRQRRPVRSHPPPVPSRPRRWPARIWPLGLVVGARLGLGDAGMATRSGHWAPVHRPRGAGLTAPGLFRSDPPYGPAPAPNETAASAAATPPVAPATARGPADPTRSWSAPTARGRPVRSPAPCRSVAAPGAHRGGHGEWGRSPCRPREAAPDADLLVPLRGRDSIPRLIAFPFATPLIPVDFP